nr:hypothetical protein [Micromonospora sp. NBRC 107566]
MKGSTYKRCRCRDDSGKDLEARCRFLRRKDGSWNPRHGQWYFRVEVPVVDGARRKVLKRGGYATQTEAETLRRQIELLMAIPAPGPVGDQARQDLLVAVEKALKARGALPDYDEMRRRYATGQALNATMTVGQWLDEWLTSRRKIRKSTRRSYEAHIRLYLKPHLGHLPIDRLRVVHIAAMFDAIDADNEFIRAAWACADAEQRAAVKGRRIVSAATKQRIRATLRAALNRAIKQEQLITVNHAAFVELESGKRPKAMVWTEEHVAAWRENRARRNAAVDELNAARQRSDLAAVARLTVEINHLDDSERPVTRHGLDGGADRTLPRFHQRGPAVPALPPHRLPGAAAGRGMRRAVDRPEPHSQRAHGRRTARSTRLGSRGRKAQERRRRPSRRLGQADPRGPGCVA